VTGGATLEAFAIFSSLMTLAAGLIWIERRLLGLFQERLGPNRVGPLGILQPLADVIKLLAKEDWTPPFADRPVFVLAPVALAASAILAFAVVPVAPGLGVLDLEVGLLYFLAFEALGVYGILLAGWASGSKYALLGGLRAGAQTISYAVFLGLSAMGVVILAGTFDLRAIVEAQRSMWFVVYQPVGAVLFFLGGLAQAHRLPFDLPEGESELVGGYHTEYSSMKFGLFFVGEYVAMVVVSAVTATLYLGGWSGPGGPSVAWLLVKTLGLIGLMILCRASFPRPRFDQLMRWAWTVGLPLSLANLLATGALTLAASP